MQFKNPILMAQIGAPQGIKGEVRVKSFTGDPLALGDYGALHSLDGRRFKIKRLRPHKTVVVVKFEGTNTREEAEALNRTELYLERSRLPQVEDDNEFYVSDLIGLAVVDEAGTIVGKIVAAPDFGAGSLLEIASGDEQSGFSNKTWLLEFTSKNVPNVDLDGKRITINLPDEVSERET